MAKISFGILLPTTLQITPTKEQLDRFIQKSEELNYHSIWTLSRFIHPIPCLDDLTTLTRAATITRKIKIGSSVFLLMFRNPIIAAKELSTLDYLSAGRLILGVSLGGRDWEYEAAGITTQKRIIRFVESIRIMRSLWTEDVTNFSGKVFNLKDIKMFPKPIQNPIPIIIAGTSDSSVKRAGKIGDGYLETASGTAEKFRENWQKVVATAKNRGRDPDKLEAVKLIYTYVSNNSKEAFGALKKWADAYYLTNYDVETNCIYGTPEECVPKIQKYIDAGVKTMIFGPQTTDTVQLEKLKDSVLNHFQ